jgi:glycosyltransferase involved in cell wall biosynthesis
MNQAGVNASARRRASVAAVIPTKNVAPIIGGTLESLRFCDEVIVVDMFSTDETRRICESYPNVRFFERDDYIYGNFNFGVSQAASDWIIRLDSDERLGVELQQQICALLERGPDCDVYEAPFTSYFLGHPIRHGSGWEQPVRKTLFRKGTLLYRVKSEHEDLAPTGASSLKTGRLRGRYHHFSTASVSSFVRKLDYYSERDFERARPGEVHVIPPWRLLVAVGNFFFRQYIVERGYRDGYAGFALCSLNAMYRLVHELKAWEHVTGGRENHDRAREDFDAALRASSASSLACGPERT